MTPERWAQVQRVLDAALNLDPSERPAYLASECAEDRELRSEVESLLGQADRLEGFLDPTTPEPSPSPPPPFVNPRALQPGDRVAGSYVIIRQIGEGGMGVVYSARDAALQRDVALKFLSIPGSAELHERFKREMRAASALNHPNVCTIYGSGEDQGHPFLVMELLEGQTLKDRIRKGPIPPADLIDLASGAAGALACAHAAGIIHRDIKPGNLFVTSSGTIKVLDFGLAKRVASSTRQEQQESLQLTHSGRALGTIAYMSPEQARGETLDARTDLFSFGAVLYEMATGRPAFDGDTAAVVFSAILNDPPVRPASLNAAIPPGLEAIILKALEKDREVRYQTASDLRADLLRLKRDTGSGESEPRLRPAVSRPPVPGAPGRRRGALVLVLGVAAVLTALAAAAWLYRSWSTGGVPRLLTSVQLTADGSTKSYRGGLGYPLMTDGSRIFFSRENEVTTEVAQVSVAGGEVAPVPTPFSPSRAVGLSPDGSKLLVLEGGDREAPLWLVATVGGAPRRLSDIRAHDATWRPDGKQIVYARGLELYSANPDGSASRRLTAAGGVIDLPRWSPDSRRLLYSVYNNQTLRHELWELVPDSGAPPRRVFPNWVEPHGAEFAGAWMPDGHSFLFSAAKDRVGLTWLARQPVGIAARLRGPAATAEPLIPGPMRTYCAVPSPDGKQVFFVGVVRGGQLVRYNPRTAGWEPYLGGISAEMVSSSRDGQWVVYVSFPEGIVWKSRADGKGRVQLTPESMVATSPAFSPDGTRILFTAQRRDGGSPWKLHLVSADGGDARQLTAGPDAEFSPAWAPDGKSAAFGSFPGNSAPLAIRFVDIATGQTSVIPGSEGLYSPRWSPDGRYLVASAQNGFRPMLYDFAAKRWTPLADRAVNSMTFTRDSAILQFDTAVYGEKDVAVFRMRLDDRRVERVANFAGRFTSSTQTPWSGLSEGGSLLAMKDLGSQEIYSVRLAQ